MTNPENMTAVFAVSKAAGKIATDAAYAFSGALDGRVKASKALRLLKHDPNGGPERLEMVKSAEAAERKAWEAVTQARKARDASFAVADEADAVAERALNAYVMGK
jgi:hypothetical protein